MTRNSYPGRGDIFTIIVGESAWLLQHVVGQYWALRYVIWMAHTERKIRIALKGIFR